MMFCTRPGIEKQFETVHDFGIKNLVVSGCSFTHNNHDSSAVSWPYYLRDFGNFKHVMDCSLPGAGNFHISNSLIWSLDNDKPDPQNSLVVVMWSGCDRDDYICPVWHTDQQYAYRFNFADHVVSAINHGDPTPSATNQSGRVLKDLANTKNRESRSIENYLYIRNTWCYLKNFNYKFVFLNFLDSETISRTSHFDIKKYLPDNIGKNLDSMLDKVVDPYSWCLKNDHLAADDFHPSITGQLNWTKNKLLPYLIEKF